MILINNNLFLQEQEHHHAVQPDAPSGSMLFWADRLLQIQQDISDHELELKRLKNVYDNAEQTLFDMMTNQQVEQFKRGGYSFTPTIKTRASIRAERKEQAIEWLKSSSYAEIVKESVHAMTLNSMVKEWRESSPPDDVQPFLDMLNMYDQQEVSIKRSR